MKNNYTYPVLLDKSEEGIINIYFPDFENMVTCIEEGGDYVNEAQDYLAMVIADYEECGKVLPESSMAEKIELKNRYILLYINIWMPYHRSKIKETYVKKTLTIPVWLDELAKSNNLNFSATLVKGLKEALNLQD